MTPGRANLSFPTKGSNLHLVTNALCKPRQAWAHLTLLTSEKLLRNHHSAGHMLSETRGEMLLTNLSI